MTDANYSCPQCNGTLSNGDGSYTCEDCELDVTEVLRHVADRDGPLADVAYQLRGELDE